MDRIQASILNIYFKIQDEKGQSAIEVIAIIAGIAIIGAAILAAMGVMGPEIGDAIMNVIRKAIGAAGG